MEKLLKAVLIKQKKISSVKEIKNYSHNLTEMINNIPISTDIDQSIKDIGAEFYKSFGIFQNKIDLKKTPPKYLLCCGTTKKDSAFTPFSLFLSFLEKSYNEVRYPSPQGLLDEYLTSLLSENCSTKPIVYANPQIIIATIRCFKLFTKLILNEQIRFLAKSNFTWSEQRNGFDEPASNTVQTYENLEKLVEYILGDIKIFNLDTKHQISS